jgi:hypothetical protein
MYAFLVMSSCRKYLANLFTNWETIWVRAGHALTCGNWPHCFSRQLRATALCRLLQAAVTDKPAASRDLNFQFYRNPAEIIADADNQVRHQTT